MNALRRVMRVPFLLGGVWLGHLLVAAAFGAVLHASVIGATEPHTPLPDGHHMFHLAELLDAEKSLVVLGVGGAIGSMLAAIVAWIVLSPFVIARLDGRSISETLEIGVRSIPGVAVQTVWHGALRAVALFLALMIVGPAPGAVKVLLVTIALGGCALALDVVRVQITLHGASRFHVRSAFFAFVRVFTNPRFLAAGVGLYAVQMLCAVVVVLAGLDSIGDGSSLWGARLLSGVAVLAGLVRLAVVVEQGEVSLVRQPRAAD